MLIGGVYLRAGDGVLDIGANDGSYATWYAERVGPSGYVLAVEPHPVAYALLSRVAETRSQLHLAQAAAFAPGHDTVRLYLDANDSRHATLWEKNQLAPGAETALVQAFSLDVLAAHVPNLRLIKIDAQGAEAHILDGATATLARDVAWVVELWTNGLITAGRSAAEVLDRFVAAGHALLDDQGKAHDPAWWIDATVRCGRQPHDSIDLLAVPREWLA